jgi:hypothetical protein
VESIGVSYYKLINKFNYGIEKEIKLKVYKSLTEDYLSDNSKDEIKGTGFLFQMNNLTILPKNEILGLFFHYGEEFDKLIKNKNFEKSIGFLEESQKYITPIVKLNFSKFKTSIPLILNSLIRFISLSPLLKEGYKNESGINLEEQIKKFQSLSFRILVKILYLIQILYGDKSNDKENSVLKTYVQKVFKNWTGSTVPFYEIFLNLWKYYLQNEKVKIEEFKYFSEFEKSNFEENQSKSDKSEKRLTLTEKKRSVNFSENSSSFYESIMKNFDNLPLEYTRSCYFMFDMMIKSILLYSNPEIHTDFPNDYLKSKNSERFVNILKEFITLYVQKIILSLVSRKEKNGNDLKNAANTLNQSLSNFLLDLFPFLSADSYFDVLSHYFSLLKYSNTRRKTSKVGTQIQKTETPEVFSYDYIKLNFFETFLDYNKLYDILSADTKNLFQKELTNSVVQVYSTNITYLNQDFMGIKDTYSFIIPHFFTKLDYDERYQNNNEKNFYYEYFLPFALDLSTKIEIISSNIKYISLTSMVLYILHIVLNVEIVHLIKSLNKSQEVIGVIKVLLLGKIINSHSN